MIHVRPMEPGDLAFAVELTATEGWGYAPEDFQRLMALEPDGCVVAREGEQSLGLATLTSYGGVAWIGSVIVAKAARGKGVGEAIMHHLLDHAEAKGIESVRLNAYVHVEKFYRRLGFKGEFENIRFVGRGRGKVFPGAIPATPGDLEALAKFDEPYFGADRRRVLKALLVDYDEGFVQVRDGGQVLGYIVAGTSTEGTEVGPWVVDPTKPKVAEGLLLHAMARARGRPVSFSSPTANPPAVAMAHAHGLDESFRTLRMYRGSRDHGGNPKGYYALGGLEKG